MKMPDAEQWELKSEVIPNSPNSSVELINWWMQKAEGEARAAANKAREYGAGDLEEIGRRLDALGVKLPMGPAGAWRTPQLIEGGIYFYIVGKMARWNDAMSRGEAVSDDTIHDIIVYCRMIQRTREVGGWPNART